MIEDKLSHDERVRLECVAQAVQLILGGRESADALTRVADAIENYVLGVPART